MIVIAGEHVDKRAESRFSAAVCLGQVDREIRAVTQRTYNIGNTAYELTDIRENPRHAKAFNESAMARLAAGT